MATKEEIIKRIEIMQAWVDGEEIQLKDGAGAWESYANHRHASPQFTFDRYEFRIKPEPREMYTVLKSIENCGDYEIRTHGEVPASTIGATRWREVLEGE